MLALTGLVVALTVVLAGCGDAGPGAPAKPSAATRTSEEGEVTVAVTWKGWSAGPVFDVAMDTHSVDLDGYDLKKLAVLRNDRGNKVLARGWDAPKGGHHREGTLSFPDRATDGGPVIGPHTRRILLVIRDVGVPERRFEWKPQGE